MACCMCPLMSISLIPPHFETAISDLEVENIETDGHMWHFKYPLAGGATYTYVEKDEDGNVTFSEERDYISIATTRPETMLGDGATAGCFTLMTNAMRRSWASSAKSLLVRKNSAA